MRKTMILLTFFLSLYSCNTDNKNDSNYDRTDDSLILVKMVNARESAMKKKDIPAVIEQFSDDATFINGDGFYCANKAEIDAFHKNLVESDSIGYYYIAGKIHVRILDNKNALVYYPNRMDWYKFSDPKDTIEKETRLLTLSAQKRNGSWQWVAITNQRTPKYFDDLTKHNLNEYLKDDSTINK